MKIGNNIHIKLETTRYGNLTVGASIEIDSISDLDQVNIYRKENGLDPVHGIMDIQNTVIEMTKKQIEENVQIIDESFDSEFFSCLK